MVVVVVVVILPSMFLIMSRLTLEAFILSRRLCRRFKEESRARRQGKIDDVF